MPGRAEYPLKRYLEAGIRVTINTDNIGISAASLTDNLLLAARMNPELSRLDLLKLQANALATAFVSHPMRNDFNNKVEISIPVP
jgi:adenosine deaminase